MKKYKVVFHVDEMNKWELTINNANNILKDVKEEVEVVVLANYESVKLVNSKENYDRDLMKETHKKGAKYIACKNALKGQKIPEEDVLDFVELVQAGVSELTKLQHEGYAYIKP